MIERLALHLDQRVVAAVHGQALGDVVIEISDAAFRIGRGDDAQRAAVGQVPEVLLRLEQTIGLMQLRLPLTEVLLLRQLAVGAPPALARATSSRAGRSSSSSPRAIASAASAASTAPA